MESLTPSQISGSFEAVGFQGGELQQNTVSIDIIQNNTSVLDTSYTLEEAIELYKTVGPRNADFLFKWLYDAYDFIYLPTIDMSYKNKLTIDKTKLAIFDVLIDDLADNNSFRNHNLLNESFSIPFNKDFKSTNAYLKVMKLIWDDCIKSIKKYPRFKEFEKIFYFDLKQIMSSMEYGYIANEMGIGNEVEDEIYLNHGCMVILHCVMDLMCSPNFKKEELPHLRKMFWWVQDIAHMGNLLNTYPKEIKERDFSSPIIAKGLKDGAITKERVANHPELALSKLKVYEDNYKLRMKEDFEKILSLKDSIESIDVNQFCNKMMSIWNGFLKREKYWEEEVEN